MRTRFKLLGTLALLTVLGAGCAPIEKIKKAASEGNGYKGTVATYTNDAVGITFNYPLGGEEVSVMDEDASKVEYSDAQSVQFYQDVESDAMTRGDYFVDMYIYEHAKNKKLATPCSELLVAVTTKTFFGTTVYFGTEKKPLYGYPGVAKAVCFQRDDYDFVMHGNEELGAESKLPVIFDSFALTR